jgi:hypothetical protein
VSDLIGKGIYWLKDFMHYRLFTSFIPNRSKAKEMIPLWIKVVYSVFVCITVVIYTRKWGWANFLWFSDIALVVTVPALWTESPLLASMMTLAILLPEVFWNISFFFRLITRKRISGLTDYMFDAERPRYLRALSFFHIFLPPLLVWMVVCLGYAPEALWYQTALAWVVFPLSYWVSSPQENINSVFGPGDQPQKRIHPLAYLGLVMIAFPLLIYFPTHLVLRLLLK